MPTHCHHRSVQAVQSSSGGLLILQNIPFRCPAPLHEGSLLPSGVAEPRMPNGASLAGCAQDGAPSGQGCKVPCGARAVPALSAPTAPGLQTNTALHRPPSVTAGGQNPPEVGSSGTALGRVDTGPAHGSAPVLLRHQLGAGPSGVDQRGAGQGAAPPASPRDPPASRPGQGCCRLLVPRRWQQAGLTRWSPSLWGAITEPTFWGQ